MTVTRGRLNELAPSYFPTIPLDPYTDARLVYKSTGDGYLLYSVGANGIDDNGLEADEFDGQLTGLRVGQDSQVE